MPAERFYIQDPSITVKKLITLEKEESHHLSHVMRLRVGETAELVNGQGTLAKGIIRSIDKHNATLEIASVHTEKKPSYQLILAQALPRLPKLEYIVEKSVELGVTDLWLFPGTLSEKKDLSPTQMERIHHITLSALKQCGRLFLPSVEILPPLLHWTQDRIPKNAFYGSTEPSAPRFLDSLLSLSPSSLLITIGPEKGFQDKEILYMEQTLHLKGISLHKNILRAETAAVHSISLSSAFIL